MKGFAFGTVVSKKTSIHSLTLVLYNFVIMSFYPITPHGVTDEFMYRHVGLFILDLHDDNIVKWRDLVMGLPVPRNSIYPDLIARLDELTEEPVCFPGAALLLNHFLPQEVREGPIETMLDLFHALNELVRAHVELVPDMLVWTKNDDTDEVAVYVLSTFVGGPDNRFADALSRHEHVD